MIIDWQKIDIVMLDMDGTILDLHYDNFFWQQWLPQSYADAKGLSLKEANDFLIPTFKEKQGQLEWYCVDYWSEVLGIDIPLEKRKQEVFKKIRFRDGAVNFLSKLKTMSIPVWLVTNAHPKVLSIKSDALAIEQYFDAIISSHDLGYPKENQKFWQKLQSQNKFNPKNVLFIDDSFQVLKSAGDFGIKNLYGIERPDSNKQALISGEFKLLQEYSSLF